ncbi:cyclopropane-fatty-acyl-phospholipid synthase [Frankia sp. CcI156]|uniref:Cyclopropane-fatty-acyl-phospholipid synthase n=1 Tax=Frankia casuarinae (strain DSM 45818 / CECT 9043 / HFP020203 / CcI3) TaxID=106370 RepID=Q2JCL1_FRACC|nr:MULTISPECIES: class I SAM-dependent methyltransferase [Frankia]ABD10981.1 Cyclopropane-fatty-acyl-phospholipid synthase [Frankia casuarinae]ETA02167.1 methyltransferase, cyclopropane fatty acid synthase [Frankia sp. CcI6]EYT92333.1 methyltransferase, cyclopropane fatty acid synthase [Frankia casuarinae]KDA42850.1 methyltransferase, cyclopropane fatty acid synthase [Frankia sp. BMG5.23]KFB05983.1 methyltransferase, cyclopropane fatty acid synthase [Frankia sp. Allo2]
MATSVGHDRTVGAAAAIRHHYDVGNDFYRLWLDRSLTYSCALREGADDTLETAQERKLRFHLDAIRADRAESVLDIGCGWGSILGRLAETHGVRRSVGLTLSAEQAAFVRSRGYPGVEVRTENWAHYEPGTRFDGIISIGAFEHFAGPDDSSAEKIRLYREFFTRCHGWLKRDGVLSLQTIAYANMSRENASAFIQQEIFPAADLPTLTEITAAAEGVFEIQSVHNGRLDYAWTCEEWARRLRRHREEAVGVVGPEVVARYERYLKLSALGFRMGKICLLRLVLQPFGSGYFEGRGVRAG